MQDYNSATVLQYDTSRWFLFSLVNNNLVSDPEKKGSAILLIVTKQSQVNCNDQDN